jgi:hypothetical protein
VKAFQNLEKGIKLLICLRYFWLSGVYGYQLPAELVSSVCVMETQYITEVSNIKFVCHLDPVVEGYTTMVK